MAEFDHIFVPVDGSDGSFRAARFAAAMAAAFAAPITLAYVVAVTPESVLELSRLSRSEIDELHKARAATALEQAREAMGDAGPEAQEVVLVGDPAEEILHYVSKHPQCLVVMGRRGLSPVKSLMLGSVSDKVMRQAGSLVTLVN